VEVDSITSGLTTPTKVDSPFTVGGAVAQGDFKFNGTIDSVMIYNRSLTAYEIKKHADDYYQNYTSQYIGDVSKFLLYRVELETDNTNITPVVNDVTVIQENYNITIRNILQGIPSLALPNNTWIYDNASTLYFYEGSDRDYSYFNYSNKDLKLYLSFDDDESNSTAVEDLSGNNRDGVLRGNTACNVSGKSGKGCRFDGNGFIEVEI
jgi:hypothetical protein